MGDKRKITLALLAAILMAALAAGCGGSSSADTNETEASKEFLKPGAKNKIATFGQEADSDEREAASEVLEENLQARAAGDWSTQCSSLSAKAIKKVAENPAAEGIKGGCAKQLEAQGVPLNETKAIRANTMKGPIAALRIKGKKAYALYHGTKGVDYAMSMEKEGDEWKVASLTTEEIP